MKLNQSNDDYMYMYLIISYICVLQTKVENVIKVGPHDRKISANQNKKIYHRIEEPFPSTNILLFFLIHHRRHRYDVTNRLRYRRFDVISAYFSSHVFSLILPTDFVLVTRLGHIIYQFTPFGRRFMYMQIWIHLWQYFRFYIQNSKKYLYIFSTFFSLCGWISNFSRG